MKRRAGLAGLLLVAVAALLLRGGDLDHRPLHNDEAINAVKLEGLWTTGRYVYDPHEYHGPVLYDAAIPVVAAGSWWTADQPTVSTMRATTVVFGVGLILVGLLVVDGLGWGGLVAGGLFIAVSPAMVYYSRYFIHELPLVFFTLLTLGAGWRYVRAPSTGWAVVAGAGLGLMYATKETFVFAVAAAGVALTGMAVVRGWNGSGREGAGAGRAAANGGRWYPRWDGIRERLRADLNGMRWQHGLWGLGMAGLVAVVLFSSIFTNPRGPLDAVRTYFIWLERAGGASPHVHPWWFYFQRLFWFQVRGGPLWTEGAVLLLALVGGVGVWWGGSRVGEGVRNWGRFLTLYTVVLAAEYAVIPYKTPWCFLGFYHGLLLLAGLGWVWLLGGTRTWRWRWIPAGLGVLAAWHLGVQAWRGSREYAADFRNPYVYGHTAQDVKGLLAQVSGLVRTSEDGVRTPIQVMVPGDGYWPLPWYWRRYERVGWWDRVPEGELSPIAVVASRLEANLEERSGQRWILAGMFELRPRVFVELYVERGLWGRYLERKSREDAEDLETHRETSRE